jgi:maltooligosyltrehalose trehalohydrolase
MARRTRQEAGRRILIIGENEPQDPGLVRPADQGGMGLDAMWIDDFHHAARVGLTGKRAAYYYDYCGKPQEFISLIKRGPLYQGQRYEWQDAPRGWTVRNEPAESLVFYLQNHDQVANVLDGKRLHQLCHPGELRALIALLLLAPETPMLFMGQEFAADAPFLYFSDHQPELQAKVDEGRITFLRQFENNRSAEARTAIPPAGAQESFLRSKLDFADRVRHREVYRLHRDLLRLRRSDPVIARQDRSRIDGAVLGAETFVLRFFGPMDDDRLLIINLGRDLELVPAPEPLLAPVDRGPWRMLWSSEFTRYGGAGAVHPYTRSWRIQAKSAVLLRAKAGTGR